MIKPLLPTHDEWRPAKLNLYWGDGGDGGFGGTGGAGDASGVGAGFGDSGWGDAGGFSGWDGGTGNANSSTGVGYGDWGSAGLDGYGGQGWGNAGGYGTGFAGGVGYGLGETGGPGFGQGWGGYGGGIGEAAGSLGYTGDFGGIGYGWGSQSGTEGSEGGPEGTTGIGGPGAAGYQGGSTGFLGGTFGDMFGTPGAQTTTEGLTEALGPASPFDTGIGRGMGMDPTGYGMGYGRGASGYGQGYMGGSPNGPFGAWGGSMDALGRDNAAMDALALGEQGRGVANAGRGAVGGKDSADPFDFGPTYDPTGISPWAAPNPYAYYGSPEVAPTPQEYQLGPFAPNYSYQLGPFGPFGPQGQVNPENNPFDWGRDDPRSTPQHNINLTPAPEYVGHRSAEDLLNPDYDVPWSPDINPSLYDTPMPGPLSTPTTTTVAQALSGLFGVGKANAQESPDPGMMFGMPGYMGRGTMAFESPDPGRAGKAGLSFEARGAFDQPFGPTFGKGVSDEVQQAIDAAKGVWGLNPAAFESPDPGRAGRANQETDPFAFGKTGEFGFTGKGDKGQGHANPDAATQEGLANQTGKGDLGRGHSNPETYGREGPDPDARDFLGHLVGPSIFAAPSPYEHVNPEFRSDPNPDPWAHIGYMGISPSVFGERGHANPDAVTSPGLANPTGKGDFARGHSNPETFGRAGPDPDALDFLGHTRGPSIFAAPEYEHVNPEFRSDPNPDPWAHIGYMGISPSIFGAPQGHANPDAITAPGLADPTGKTDMARGHANPEYQVEPAMPWGRTGLAWEDNKSPPGKSLEEALVDRARDIALRDNLDPNPMPGRPGVQWGPLDEDNKEAPGRPSVTSAPGRPDSPTTTPDGRSSFTTESPTTTALDDFLAGPVGQITGVTGNPPGGGDFPNQGVTSVPVAERATGIDMTAFAVNVSQLVGAEITPEQAATLASNPKVFGDLMAMLLQIDPTMIDRLRIAPSGITTPGRMFDGPPMGAPFSMAPQMINFVDDMR